MIRLLVFGLTGLAVVLFIIQFFSKKGTRAHITRGVLVSILSLTVVIINTLDISLKRGLTWDLPFIVHTVLGTLFFISLWITSLVGYFLGSNDVVLKTKKIKIHRFTANITAVLFFLTLVASGFIRLIR